MNLKIIEIDKENWEVASIWNCTYLGILFRK